jgi:hypothetical protein
MALPEARSEILIVKLHPVLSGYFLTHLAEQTVVLIGADKQSCGESIESLIMSGFGCFTQSQTVTIGAPVAFMAYYSLKILEHIVAFSDNKREVCFSGKGLHSLNAALVLCERVDIGIVPESSDLKPFIVKALHNICSARAAASMKKNGSHSVASKIGSLL